MIKVYYSEMTEWNQQREKRDEVMSKENQAQATKSPLPVESQDMLNSFCASYDSICETLFIEEGL